MPKKNSKNTQKPVPQVNDEPRQWDHLAIEHQLEEIRGRKQPRNKRRKELEAKAAAAKAPPTTVLQPTEVTPPIPPSTDADKTEIVRTLEAVIDWLNLNSTVLDEEAVALIDDRLASHAKKSQIFLVVSIQKRMESLVRWMEATDALEARLLDPATIATMDGMELRKTVELLEKKIDGTLKQVMLMIEQAGDLPDRFTEQEKRRRLEWEDKEVFADDPLKRENLRNKLQSLMRKKALMQ
jgi:hypothetical protein